MGKVFNNFIISCLFIGLAAGKNCKDQALFKVLIRNNEDMEFYSEVQKIHDAHNITIDRSIRTPNSIFIFRTSLCATQEIEEILKRFHVQQYEIEPYSEFSRRLSIRKFSVDDNERHKKLDIDVILRRYLSSAEIDDYVENIGEMMGHKFPFLDVKVKIEGTTYENRPIRSIFIGYKNKRNPVAILDAGIHAREWTARSLALYILHQLINEAELGENGLFNRISVLIIPNTNPDGYEYSLGYDKMWRKNRRPIVSNCIGIDGNRNYDAEWQMGEDELIPCSPVYKGEKPFSEIETQIVRDAMLRNQGQCFLYISIHTYGNEILYPYGYVHNSHPRKKLLHQVAAAGARAVRERTGTIFKAGQSGTQLYLAAGGSDDYAIDKAGIPFAYTFEVGPEKHGFIVPTRFLAKTVFDGWIAAKAMIEEARDLYDHLN